MSFSNTKNLALKIALDKGIGFYFNEATGNIIAVYKNDFLDRPGMYVIKEKDTFPNQTISRMDIEPGESIASIFPKYLTDIPSKTFKFIWEMYSTKKDP